MKRLSIVICLLLAQSLIASEKPFSPEIKQADMSKEKMITQNKRIVSLAAEALSEKLPQKIDQYTNLLKITAKGTTLAYLFEINTGAKSDETVRKEDRSRMKKAITQGICLRYKRFLDAQIHISYIYRSAASKAELFRFDISQEKCATLK